MNNPPKGPFGFAQGPEPVDGLRLRPFRPSLRASLESLDYARDAEPVEARGAKHPVETRNKDLAVVAGGYSRINWIRE